MLASSTLPFTVLWHKVELLLTPFLHTPLTFLFHPIFHTTIEDYLQLQEIDAVVKDFIVVKHRQI